MPALMDEHLSRFSEHGLLPLLHAAPAAGATALQRGEHSGSPRAARRESRTSATPQADSAASRMAARAFARNTCGKTEPAHAAQVSRPLSAVHPCSDDIPSPAVFGGRVGSRVSSASRAATTAAFSRQRTADVQVAASAANANGGGASDFLELLVSDFAERLELPRAAINGKVVANGMLPRVGARRCAHVPSETRAAPAEDACNATSWTQRRQFAKSFFAAWRTWRSLKLQPHFARFARRLFAAWRARPLLDSAPALNGGVQGLAWVAATLREDCEGDMAHGFFDLSEPPCPHSPSNSGGSQRLWSSSFASFARSLFIGWRALQAGAVLEVFDGGVQSLTWVGEQLRTDGDGDQAHEFLELEMPLAACSLVSPSSSLLQSRPLVSVLLGLQCPSFELTQHAAADACSELLPAALQWSREFACSEVLPAALQWRRELEARLWWLDSGPLPSSFDLLPLPPPPANVFPPPQLSWAALGLRMSYLGIAFACNKGRRRRF